MPDTDGWKKVSSICESCWRAKNQIISELVGVVAGSCRKMLGQQIAAPFNRPAKGLCRAAVFDPSDQLADERVPGAGRNSLVDGFVGQNLHAAFQQGNHDQDTSAFARLVQAVLVERPFSTPTYLGGHPLFRREKPDARWERAHPIAQNIGEHHAEHDPGGMVFLPSILTPPLIRSEEHTSELQSLAY